MQQSQQSTHHFIGSFPVSLYTTVPIQGVIAIRDFKEVAAARLAVLQLLDRRCGVEQRLGSLKDPSLQNEVYHLLLASGLATAAKQASGVSAVHSRSDVLQSDSQAKHRRGRYFTPYHIKMRDDVSHYVLRLAFAMEDRERQEWVISQECRLLYLKLLQINSEVDELFYNTQASGHGESKQAIRFELLSTFLKIHGINYTSLTFEDLHANGAAGTDAEELWSALCAACGLQESDTGAIFVPLPFFPDAISVVRGRRCLIKGGVAYVALHDLEVVILGRFKRLMQESFRLVADRGQIYQRLVVKDLRVGSFVTRLHSLYIGPAYGLKPQHEQILERVTPQNIDQMCLRSFPPCMRNLVIHLGKNRHLTHWGRLQLWLFLKGCGMTMEEQISHWQSLWHDSSKFKEHRYNIRHVYGQEGKRTDYSALPCSRIISGFMPNPGPGDHHGCPFRVFDSQPLFKFLTSLGAASTDLRTCASLAKEHHYQLACVEFYKATHQGSQGDAVGNHPNTYFNESCKFHTLKANKTALNALESTSEEQTDGCQRQEPTSKPM